MPVSDALLTATAELRHACRLAGHALHELVHANDLWIAASAIRIGAPLLTTDRWSRLGGFNRMLPAARSKIRALPLVMEGGEGLACA